MKYHRAKDGIQSQSVLWVCWQEPPHLPGKAKILSFLRPLQEERCRRKYGSDNVISGRTVAQDVKDEALKMYTRVVARMAAEQVYKGRSLRESLKKNGDASQWWYHVVSAKDCESDSTFNNLVEILAIEKVILGEAACKLILWRAERSVADVIRSKYAARAYSKLHLPFFFFFLRAVLSRIRSFIIQVYQWYAVKQHVADAAYDPEIVFEGFWDWSVAPSTKNAMLEDRYFKSLPRELENSGLKTAWFIWFSPHFEPRSLNRQSRHVLSAAQPHRSLIFLQKYLTMRDFSVFGDFSQAFIYLVYSLQPEFRRIFHQAEFDLFPLFKHNLAYYFWNSSLPDLQLVALACKRAFEACKPQMALSFLELYPYSRAFYAGARRGSPGTILASVQHASYSREKTYVRLDPELEFQGSPDHCPIPKPDVIFAMGKLGKDIFEECGFPAENVLLTGSSRYEHISDIDIRKKSIDNKKKRLLMVTTLDKNMEMDMIEAVCLASRDIPELQLCLRSHPFAEMREHPEFQKFSEWIHITAGILEDDLEGADLILFSYSTVAEEAFIRGIPVWQWRSSGFNGSSFRDIQGIIPSFTSVGELAVSLKAFVQNPRQFSPSPEARNLVKKMCFFTADGNPSKRIREHIQALMMSAT